MIILLVILLLILFPGAAVVILGFLGVGAVAILTNPLFLIIAAIIIGGVTYGLITDKKKEEENE